MKAAEEPGEGVHIVWVSGDEEYRSEEALPAVAKIMAVHHGFKCTVLFAINSETGEIDPNDQTNIPGLHHLETADLMVLFTRFRELPDEQMKYIVDFTNSGKPFWVCERQHTPLATPEIPTVPTPNMAATMRCFRADMVVKCWAKPGSRIMDITEKRVRAV